jgi:hypothetical protein
MLNSGGFVVGLTEISVGGFETFARGLVKDTFDLSGRSRIPRAS